MLNIKNIVAQLKEEDYKDFAQTLIKSKAEKLHTLLQLLRDNSKTEEKIMEELKVNASAFYTLKSRLNDKLQEFMMERMEGPKLELLRKVAHIPTLIFSTDKDVAISVLTKLEEGLIKNDMPNELILVYNALKKLHLHSGKYYEYTQSYNRHIAYMLAINKVEDLLIDFNKKLSDYLLSRDKSLIEILSLIKQQVANTCELYESHHLYVYRSIVDISLALFLPHHNLSEKDEPVEDVLAKVNEIMKDNPTDQNYRYLNLVFRFLSFEYYHQHKIPKKEKEHFDIVNENLFSFLLYNFTTFPACFLISKIQRYAALNKLNDLYEENKSLNEKLKPDKNDLPNYIFISKYLSLSAFYASKYEEAIDKLNDLKNSASFINYPHEDFEIKLLLALFYSFVNEYDLAENNLRSVERKARELTDRNYENIFTFIKLLRLPMKSKTKDIEEKMREQLKLFEFQNQGEYKILECLKWNDKMIARLSTLIK